MKKEHGDAEWQLFIQSNKKKASQLLEDISKNHIVSISWALHEKSIYMADKEQIPQNFVFVFSTQEDKRAFEMYLHDVWYWPIDEMNDFNMSDSGVVKNVFLMEDIKKTLKKPDGAGYWG